jgi:hypothetical protein
MELTEAQRERIHKNRERALEIQRQRRKVQQQQQALQTETEKDEHEKNNNNNKKREITTTITTTRLESLNKKHKTTSTSTSIIIPLEDFEIGASEWANKKEAKDVYCLSEGTLAVCEVQERANPHHKGWNPMKLYKREELREWAYKRFEGRDGWMAERKARREKRLAKDLKEAENVFK